MTEALFNPNSKRSIDSFLANPSHAVMLVGSRGVGKVYVAKYIAKDLLKNTTNNIDTYAFLTFVQPSNRSISIDQIREAQKLLVLQVPGKELVRRIVIIQDAHTMTVEAQNALLKSLEEPPKDTVIILTAIDDQRLLPTITSRVQTIDILPLSGQQMKSLSNNDSLLAIANGLPGLLHDLEHEENNELVKEIANAKEFLTKTTFERQIAVSTLKEREQVAIFLQALVIVSSAAMRSAVQKNSIPQIRAWQRRTKQIHLSQKQLAQNASVKLLLTDLALGL